MHSLIPTKSHLCIHIYLYFFSWVWTERMPIKRPKYLRWFVLFIRTPLSMNYWVLLLTIRVKTRKDVLARPANVNVDLFLSMW